MDKIILAIGGHVIKTAKDELREVISRGKVEMLIHNGGSIFHDFQQEIECDLPGHSYPMEHLLQDYECNREASKLVIKWLYGYDAPEDTITRYCDDNNIPVLLFTGLACDFWQLFAMPSDWQYLARNAFNDFETLCNRMKNQFHYLCMGSAVIHPEVFAKALAKTKPKDFKADVVDFKQMYRPDTRVSRYGKYYLMTHKEFFEIWLSGKYPK